MKHMDQETREAIKSIITDSYKLRGKQAALDTTTQILLISKYDISYLYNIFREVKLSLIDDKFN